MLIMNIDLLNEFLPAVLYIVVIALVITLTVLAVKLIQVTTKLNRISDNVEEKVNSLNGIFGIVDKVSNASYTIVDKAVNTVLGTVGKIKKNKEESKDE
ncbi:MAG: hypothetical protein IJH18_00610 [Bacilli bacterium]|nr:hypothetical protein [Bacilli bacterium]